MSITVTLLVGGQPLVAQLDDDALATIAAAVTPATVEPPSPYMTVVEAAEHLRCSRQRVDDLLSSGRLHRIKDGSRTLIARSQIDSYLTGQRP